MPAERLHFPHRLDAPLTTRTLLPQRSAPSFLRKGLQAMGLPLLKRLTRNARCDATLLTLAVCLGA